ncbi:hypothetical protein U1Q18_033892 [Sarracenia purpurea var. burkii]
MIHRHRLGSSTSTNAKKRSRFGSSTSTNQDFKLFNIDLQQTSVNLVSFDLGFQVSTPIFSMLPFGDLRILRSRKIRASTSIFFTPPLGELRILRSHKIRAFDRAKLGIQLVVL